MVPVLPAVNAPGICARVAVPCATTVESIPEISSATEDFSTGQLSARPSAFSPSGILIGLSLPSSGLPIMRMPAGPGTRLPSRLRSTAPGLIVVHVRRPPRAKVWYACAMSSGVTPSLRPPSVIARLCDTGVRMPSRRASRAIFRVPTWTPTWA